MVSSADSPVGKLEQLRALAASLEAQRPILGATVDAMLAPLLAQIATLEGQASPPSSISPSRQTAPIVEERKIVTVLLADISGFTAMSEKMDPESVRDLINACFDHLVPSIEKYEGTVEKFVGDEIMAMFGAPVAHEDDAERAVRAALDMLSALTAFNAKRRTGLGVHIGINTGLVLAGAIGTRAHQQYGVTGDAVNLAARLLHSASTGEIYIGHTTFRHVRGLFEVDALEPLTLKGKSEPVRAYAVRRESPRAFGRGSRGIDGVQTQMVGRAAELTSLSELFAAIHDGGPPRLALVVGEAGMGKSRLLFETMEWLGKRSDQPWLLRGRARAEMSGTPFSAWRDVWADHFGLNGDDAPEITRQIFELGIAGLWESGGASPNVAAEEVAHVVGYLMGMDWPASSYLGPLRSNAQQAQGRAFHLIQQLFIRMGALRPLVVVLEDLHWADTGTLDLLSFLLDAGPALPLLILGTARPEALERFPRLHQAAAAQTTIRLQALSDGAALGLLLDILGHPAGSPPPLIERVVEKAEGNPYYLEEMVKMLIEHGAVEKTAGGWRVAPADSVSVSLPDTLHGLLQARLDALDLRQKDVAQRASVVGRVFWVGAVEATEPVGDVLVSLEQLARRDMVHENEPGEFAGQLELIFKHALLRDVAYETVPVKQRRVYHSLVARWLEANAGDEPMLAARIAHHCEEADEKTRALTLYRQAAKAAAERFANQEAVDLLGRALSLVGDPEEEFGVLARREVAFDWLGQRGGQRQALERMLEIAHQRASLPMEIQTLNRQAGLLARTGESAPATAAAERALELAKIGGDRAGQAQALRNLGNVAFYDARWQDALTQFHGALGAAQDLDDYALKADSLNAIGAVHIYMGSSGEALRFLGQAREIVKQAGDDWRLARILSNSSMVEATLGHYQTALFQKLEVLDLQRAMGNRQSEAIVLTNLGVEYHRLGLYDLAEAQFRECGRFFPLLKSPWGTANNLSNWALTCIEQGRCVESLAMLEEARQLVQGKGVGQDLVLELLNRRVLANLRLSNREQAAEALAEASAWLEQLGGEPDKGQLALLWSHRAELALLAGDAAGALAASEESIAILGGHSLRHDIRRETLLTRARALQASGRQDRAGLVLDQARRLVEESAQGLNETFRESYLHNVMINRLIVEGSRVG